MNRLLTAAAAAPLLLAAGCAAAPASDETVLVERTVEAPAHFIWESSNGKTVEVLGDVVLIDGEPVASLAGLAPGEVTTTRRVHVVHGGGDHEVEVFTSDGGAVEVIDGDIFVNGARIEIPEIPEPPDAPLAPGEVREVRRNVIVLADGAHREIEVRDGEVTIDGETLDGHAWTDEDGRVFTFAPKDGEGETHIIVIERLHEAPAVPAPPEPPTPPKAPE